MTIPGINAQLSGGGAISGSVKDSLGAGLGADIRLYSVLDGRGPRASVTSAAGGGFTFGNVTPGDYKIFFDATGTNSGRSGTATRRHSRRRAPSP